MAIILKTSDESLDSLKFNSYPNQFVSEKKKQGNDYIKDNLDYFANIAYSQYLKKKDEIVRNYDLLNGILHEDDFYAPEVKSFIDTLKNSSELSPDVKHYPILNPPLNTLTGELSNRPDIARVKAMDAESQSQELQAKTDIVQQYIIETAKTGILAKYSMQTGEVPEEEELQKLTLEQVGDYLTNYTSIAEKWANRALNSCKVEFNIKEKSEECFRDLIVCSREFFHIYEDNSKTGIGVESVNPKNQWQVNVPNKKYTSDPTGGNQGVPASGIVSVKELSEIIERFKLSKEDIDHLKKNESEPNHLSVESSFNNRGATGMNSIKYPQYSPLLELERTIIEAQIEEENGDDISPILGLSSSVTSFGNKFVVVEAYWVSKKKIGSLTFLNEKGVPETILVDEEYETIPNEISIEWGYINQWMKGTKIGPHVYLCEPLRILNYCPIIGVTHGGRNSKATSIVDMMKPLQIIYNICWNQIFRILEKEHGVFIEFPMRKIIVSKDGDAQDALDMFEEEIRTRGITYTDESVENTKVPISNTSKTSIHDASRGNELMSRLNLALMVKNECWELVGITRQRLGSTSGATETATATQAGLSQSYTQTEYLFTQHQYVLNQLYQAIVDACQYVTVQKPNSTISYLSNDGDEAFMQINSEDISMRDLKVFITSRAEDAKIFQKFQEYGDTMLQNGADMYDVSVLYETGSVRQKQDILLKLKKERKAFEQQQQQLEQQKLEQAQAQFEEDMRLRSEEARLIMENDNYNKELDRINKKELAYIQTFARQEDNTKDADGSGVPDMLEYNKLNNESAISNRDNATRIMELQQKNQEQINKIALEREKLQVARENMKNDKDIAKINAKNKPKPAAKKKK